MESDDAEAEICKLQTLIGMEEDKFTRYKNENIRRRHNYLPFIIELLKLLSKEGKLTPIIQKVIFKKYNINLNLQND